MELGRQRKWQIVAGAVIMLARTRAVAIVSPQFET
jgi:hypothetical protein